MKRALVLSLAIVLGLGIAAFTQVGDLTGEWSMNVTIDPGAPTVASFFGFGTDLTITYSVGGWDLSSISTFDDTGWTAQSFIADGSFGAFGVTSTAVFDTSGAFTSLELGLGYTFGAVEIDIGFMLLPGDLNLTLGLVTTTGLVEVDVELTFGDSLVAGCDLNWTGATITLGIPFCCADASATVVFDCNGFVEACLTVEDIVVAYMPWLSLTAELCFELETKTLVLTPEFDFGADICFDVYITQAYTGGIGPLGGVLNVQDISISGIGLECEIGGVVFSGISYWGPAPKPGILEDTPYWEAYQIQTADLACCGDFTFDVAMFFDALGTELFDIAALYANFAYDLGENFTFTMGFDYEIVPPSLLWTIGFVITW